MSKPKEIELLENAKAEITDLRSQNSNMSIRLNAIDDMLLLVRSKPPTSDRGYAPDILWEIERYLSALKPKEENQ